MKLYNSLSRKTDVIEPIKTGAIGFYSCGPTVYNKLHIGNLSAFIYADLLARTLRVSGLNVNHVMNITDVDDKTIRDSKVEFPDEEPIPALKQLTAKYTKIFINDIKSVGNNVDNIKFISAVDSIPQMIKMIQNIIDNGFGYISDDGIYFSISTYQEAGNSYGKLGAIDLSKSQSRISSDEYDKDTASDFALWKKHRDDEPSWNADFVIKNEKVSMPGRPGWHIECSVMSTELLGAPFDIHSGGIDLMFPHHENEIAQAIASGYDDFCNIFFHNNHLLVDGKKMSKSLNNFYTLDDIKKHGFEPQVFRLLTIQGHYRTESNFSWDSLSATKNRLQHWQNIADLRFQPIGNDTVEVCNVKDVLLEHMSNDLNSVLAIAHIETEFFDPISEKGAINKEQVSVLTEGLNAIKEILGINLLDSSDIIDSQKALINERTQARNNKDWAKSDSIRDQLLSEGIALNDTNLGVIWNRV